ncbi:low molecular weight phosphatase family protein [Marinovum sp. 2_MG-2023]|uniref:arsenate-mycothiol transferase ArsC n=1 Tax=Roseobacteraceae TaxID=2854170 RepID=UPI0026E2FC14|nr:MULTISPECIES: low molecular weight phosphatase family protein [unclassified Marinovum]MDO6731499.1 low molecular weight phosphatase family protein [Marinovum sp. 2_MG-2023]MDO6780859.1 low molecular weight phosphatase family protein [Marinovum sp. 1_MG-2023]
MTLPLPQSILFCCDHNAVRSPMAEAIMKKLYGQSTYVQSVGVRNDLEVDGYAICVCNEIGVQLDRHRSRSFDEMEHLGEALSSFDLVVALSPLSRAKAEELTRCFHLKVDYWPVFEPTDHGTNRTDKLAAYRKTRDEIVDRLKATWGADRARS